MDEPLDALFAYYWSPPRLVSNTTVMKMPVMDVNNCFVRRQIMTSKTYHRPLFLFAVIFVCIEFYGCTSSPSSTPQNEQEITSTAITARSATYSLTPPPTNPLLKPTRTPAFDLPSTLTPLATYSPAQASQIMRDLYENNTCKLPCWWGITPGKTSWLEAWQFLKRFNAATYPPDILPLESKSLPGYIYYRVSLDIPQALKDQVALESTYIFFQIKLDNFYVEYVDDAPTGKMDAYILPKILSDYGKPKQIYVLGGETPIQSVVSLFLYYPQYGFISIQSDEVERKLWSEPNFTTCFQEVFGELSLWPQDKPLDFYERLKIGGVDSDTLGLVKPLDKVSNFTTDEYYDAFISNGSKPPCIQFDTNKLLVP